ncbi:DUF6457 domain-containing protein [Humibacter sp.]|jgi:uncharacterized caspase-like protein|uniref:DUF6457 domain-containing protein n=1 Tax=Humibacter sp. TaxID=1940291 RepID=UPI002BF45A08|nr:DUF6457 domain-containing protein [Humibacter sp.]HVX08190.1 DUF6457 domain-containing protein [Humibacter sp.]
MSAVAPDELTEWVVELACTLGIAPDDVPIGRVLDLARDVAHGVVRAGAPLSAFVVGVAIGRGLDGDEAWRRATALLEARATAGRHPSA